MKRSLNRREADHYFKKCLELFPWQKKGSRTDSYYPYLSESPTTHYLSFPPEHVRPFELTGQLLIEATNASYESPLLCPDDQTYFVMDISRSKETSYNTIMYQLNDYPKKSMETTTVIMNRYFDSKCFSYASMMKFGETMGYKRSLPYILGETYFVPDRGATKKPASWFALHHVVNYYFDPIEKHLTLLSHQHPILTLNLSESVFLKQLNVAAHLYFTQTKLVDGLAIHFGLCRNKVFHENIVHRQLEQKSYQLPQYTAQDYLQFLSYFKAQQVLTILLGEDNPYLEDSRSHFEMPKNRLK